MKIESQVCSLEQAKRLEDLGIIAVQPDCRPAYFWIFDSGMKWRLVPCGYEYLEEEEIEYYPAFTVAELGVMLNGAEHRITLEPSGKYLTLERGLPKAFFYATDTEAQARDNLLIYLLENSLVTVEEVNTRLSA